MEIQIVLSTDNTFFARLARRLGAEWTHAMLRFEAKIGDPAPITAHLPSMKFYIPKYRIIESGFRHGVVERPWNPEEYSKYAVYRLKAEPDYLGASQHILDYARGQRGKFYAWDKLLLLLPRFIHRIGRRLTRRMIRGVGAMGVHVWWRAHICSSLVDQSFGYAGFDLVSNIDTPWVFPDDFRDSPLLELLPPEGAEEWPK